MNLFNIVLLKTQIYFIIKRSGKGRPKMETPWALLWELHTHYRMGLLLVLSKFVTVNLARC